MGLARNRSFLGIAKETRPAAGVAPTGVAATDYIPCRSITPLDDIKYLPDTGWRGSMVDEYAEVQGLLHSTFEFQGDLFPDTFGYPLFGLLGDLATTGASAPYTHTGAVLNSGNGQPTTYSLSDYYGLTGATSTRQFPGCQFTEVEVKGNADGLLEYTAKAVGYASALVANPTPNFSAIAPLQGWTGQATMGGTPSSGAITGGTALTNIGQFSLKMSRPVSVIPTMMNAQRPYQVFVGPLAVEGTLTAITEDDTLLTPYLTGLTQPLQINSTLGAGAALVAANFQMSACLFKVVKVVRGKDYVENEIQFKAFGSTNDAGASGGRSPIKAVLKNAKTTGTFA